MNRLLASILMSCFFVITAAFADDNVRAAQATLTRDGFYFGETDGKISTDFSTAVTRYQIRNGLPITGQLDAETSKALGLKPSTTAAAVNAAPTSETWRHLRKSDPPVRPAPGKAPTAALVPAQTGDSSTWELSPERLRDYVGAFVLAGLDPQVGAELEFFGDRVRYYGDGIVGREKIRRDLLRYDARWPQRRFWLGGEVKTKVEPDSELRVTFPLRFELRNGQKHTSGMVEKSLLLQVTGGDLQIVAVNEEKAR